LAHFFRQNIDEEIKEWVMRSAAMTGIPGVDPMSLAHLLGHEIESLPGSHTTRIVFVVVTT
jgi:hypothetical protein